MFASNLCGPQCPERDEVLRAELGRVLPVLKHLLVGVEDVQQSQVIAVHVSKPCLGFVGSPERVVGPQKDRQHAQHRGNRQRLIAAPMPRSIDKHLRHLWVGWQSACHLSNLCDVAVVIEAAQVVQDFYGSHEGLWRRGVDEVEMHDVIEAEHLQHQNYGAQIGPHELWMELIRQLIVESLLRVNAKALSWSSPPGHARTRRS
mmetsp:Transcript_17520/g.28034  ORF Transcript_17520/g.28034 Transcript_17520/m.28034 type:complete len:203 (+) Transcript_17520:122-730(+)